MQSTISIFRKMYENIPPLFPEEIKVKMRHALMHLEEDGAITLEEIERTMIVFGYEAWPWNEAYKEFFSIAEFRVGEHFLLPKLSPETLEKYEKFKHYGGSLRALHSGKPAEFFTTEERSEICKALVEMQAELRQYTNREITGLGKRKYLNRVEEFKGVLGEIKLNIGRLKDLADKEQDHPVLANEIREKVKGFEHSLCLLGQELDFQAVCESSTFFSGRKEELNRLRGILVVK